MCFSIFFSLPVLCWEVWHSGFFILYLKYIPTSVIPGPLSGSLWILFFPSNILKLLSGVSWCRFVPISSVQFSLVQSLSRVRLFATPWIAACQASLSITNSWSSLRVMYIESVMPSSHLILCRPLLLWPSIPPSIKIFSNESTLRMRWPKYWSFSFSIIPYKEIPGLISECLSFSWRLFLLLDPNHFTSTCHSL